MELGDFDGPPGNADALQALRSACLPDDFWMYNYKVLPCPHGYRHSWTHCPFSHTGETARRRCPRNYHYLPDPCVNVRNKRQCPNGDACPYSHNTFEQWLHPARYRTRLCYLGANCRRPTCFFAHSVDELRSVEEGESGCFAGNNNNTVTAVPAISFPPPLPLSSSCGLSNLPDGASGGAGCYGGAGGGSGCSGAAFAGGSGASGEFAPLTPDSAPLLTAAAAAVTAKVQSTATSPVAAVPMPSAVPSPPPPTTTARTAAIPTVSGLSPVCHVQPVTPAVYVPVSLQQHMVQPPSVQAPHDAPHPPSASQQQPQQRQPQPYPRAKPTAPQPQPQQPPQQHLPHHQIMALAPMQPCLTHGPPGAAGMVPIPGMPYAVPMAIRPMHALPHPLQPTAMGTTVYLHAGPQPQQMPGMNAGPHQHPNHLSRPLAGPMGHVAAGATLLPHLYHIAPYGTVGCYYPAQQQPQLQLQGGGSSIAGAGHQADGCTRSSSHSGEVSPFGEGAAATAAAAAAAAATMRPTQSRGGGGGHGYRHHPSQQFQTHGSGQRPAAANGLMYVSASAPVVPNGQRGGVGGGVGGGSAPVPRHMPAPTNRAGAAVRRISTPSSPPAADAAAVAAAAAAAAAAALRYPEAPSVFIGSGSSRGSDGGNSAAADMSDAQQIDAAFSKLSVIQSPTTSLPVPTSPPAAISPNSAATDGKSRSPPSASAMLPQALPTSAVGPSTTESAHVEDASAAAATAALLQHVLVSVAAANGHSVPQPAAFLAALASGGGGASVTADGSNDLPDCDATACNDIAFLERASDPGPRSNVHAAMRRLSNEYGSSETAAGRNSDPGGDSATAAAATPGASATTAAVPGVEQLLLPLLQTVLTEGLASGQLQLVDGMLRVKSGGGDVAELDGACHVAPAAAATATAVVTAMAADCSISGFSGKTSASGSITASSSASMSSGGSSSGGSSTRNGSGACLASDHAAAAAAVATCAGAAGIA
ncbi:hypothetical protein Agub_g2843 [Astrephomene gubernaculifera]|uniref:C3H1-type domain-containing protein n=1 Tax=Astrephomene gubernaculifera TaxID=47775 RepID=A0AAD3DHN6_9CHLO|nr:hypothetical protein Agub_g2843 [Astrephomene gubernaculifera]